MKMKLVRLALALAALLCASASASASDCVYGTGATNRAQCYPTTTPVDPASGQPIGSITDTRATNLTLSAAFNSSLDIPLNGQNIVGLRFSGLTASGATISFLSSNDATQVATSPISSFNASTGISSSTRNADGETRIPVSGRATLRLQITTGGTGSITVSYTAGYNGTLTDLASPLPPGSNSVGALGASSASGGVASFSRIPSSAASTNATSAKTAAGRLYKIYACNTTTTAKYVKLFNKASAPVPGTDAVLFSRVLPPSATAGVPLCQSFDQADIGWYFSTGIAYALTGGNADTDATALAAGDVTQVSVEFQ